MLKYCVKHMLSCVKLDVSSLSQTDLSVNHIQQPVSPKRVNSGSINLFFFFTVRDNFYAHPMDSSEAETQSQTFSG